MKPLNKEIKIPELREWQPEKFFVEKNKIVPFTCVITASRKSGKSNLLKYIYLKKGGGKIGKKFSLVVIFSHTLANNFYQSFIDTKLLYSKYRPDVVEAVLSKAKKARAQGKALPVLFIMDDCISSRDKYDDQLTEIFTNGRHYYASLIYITQKLSFGSTTWFNNCTLFCILRCANKKEKEYVAEKVLINELGDLDLTASNKYVLRYCEAIINKYTQNYGALIIMPFVGSTDITDKIQYFKAENMDRVVLFDTKPKKKKLYDYLNEEENVNPHESVLNSEVDQASAAVPENDESSKRRQRRRGFFGLF